MAGKIIGEQSDGDDRLDDRLDGRLDMLFIAFLTWLPWIP